MRRSEDFWDVIPIRLVAGCLAAAGVCAGVGLLAPPLKTVAVVVYGTVAIGLTVFGLFGSLAATFEEGFGHGMLCLLLPPIYPIYFYATHPENGFRPFVNMVLGLALMWIANLTFPMFRQADATPAPAAVAGKDPLEGIGPGRNDPEPPGAAQVTATTSALAKLLAGVTDEPSARKAAPRYRQLIAERRTHFAGAGEPKALDEQGKLASISALVKLGPRFRDANRDLNAQWKRVRRVPGLFKILEGTR